MGGQEVETAQHLKTTLKDFCHKGEQGNLGWDVELYNLSKKGANRVCSNAKWKCSTVDGVIEDVKKRGIIKGIKASSGREELGYRSQW